MLKVKSKIVTILFLILAVCFSAVAFNAYKVNATQSSDAEIVYAGASLRGGDQYSGIRFTSLIEKDAYDTLASNNAIEFHTLIVPTQLLGNDTLTRENAEAKTAKDIIVGGYQSVTLTVDGQETNYYAFNAVIYGIDAEYYGTELTAVSYAKLTDSNNAVSYIDDTQKLNKVANGYEKVDADYIERSVLQVAQSLIANGTENDKAIAQGFIDQTTGVTYSFDYTIEYYFDGVKDASKTEIKTVQCAYGATVTADEKDFDGYVLDETAENVKSAVINADGSTVLKLYYKEDAIVLSTADDVYNFFSQFVTLSADIGGNVVLGADIDMSKGTYDYTALNGDYGAPVYALGTSVRNGDVGFTGTFDGRGHSITGLRVGNTRGLFGKVKSSAIIKNVSFIDAIVCGSQALFATWFGGELKDVYIDVTLRRPNGDSDIAPICLEPYDSKVMSLKNCVLVVKIDKILNSTTNETTGAIGYSLNPYGLARAYHQISCENVTLFTDITYIFSGKVKTDVETLLNVYPLKNAPNGKATFDKSVATQYAINVSDIIPSAIATDFTLSEISYNGATVGNISNGVWTVDNSVIAGMASGDYEFKAIITSTLLSDVKIETVIEVAIVDQVLKTADDVYNYFKQFENITVDIGGYTVLGADIDMSKGSYDYTSMTGEYPNYPLGCASITSSYGFTGIFDGKGHSITGLRIRNNRGLFGNVRFMAIVRNVSFIDMITIEAQATLGTYFAGTLENVYLDVTLRRKEWSNTISPICLQAREGYNNQYYYMSVSNCVLVVKYDHKTDGSGEDAYKSLFGFIRDDAYLGDLTIENLHIVTNSNYITQGHTKADVADIITCYSLDEYNNGNANFDKLDQNIWDLTGNKPTLK